ncbi:MAG: R3H domain-containing nucleic acid-binding protein [Acidobacteriota bacterium]|nr:R3H domain-containing nucleic acid-binding protein [Acidobacteriota bacterium]
MTDAAIAPEERDDLDARMRSFVAALDLDVEVETEELEEATLYFNIQGADEKFFLNNRTESMRSLGQLLQTYLEHHYPDSKTKVKIDAGGFVRGKEEELKQMALEAAGELKEPGDRTTLESLNPYDRRIVHLALREMTHLQTESIGDGHYKRMVIRYVGEPADAEVEASAEADDA